jgi:hypothetical protein
VVYKCVGWVSRERSIMNGVSLVGLGGSAADGGVCGYTIVFLMFIWS